MTIRRATAADINALARLIVLDTPAAGSVRGFAADLTGWWNEHHSTHHAFVAQVDDSIVGMAWVALLPRVARPGATSRLSADIQTVFVIPDHRRTGIGSALVEAAAQHATRLGASRVTVHSGRRAVSLYEGLGFRSSPQLLKRES